MLWPFYGLKASTFCILWWAPWLESEIEKGCSRRTLFWYTCRHPHPRRFQTIINLPMKSYTIFCVIWMFAVFSTPFYGTGRHYSFSKLWFLFNPGRIRALGSDSWAILMYRPHAQNLFCDVSLTYWQISSLCASRVAEKNRYSETRLYLWMDENDDEDLLPVTTFVSF